MLIVTTDNLPGYRIITVLGPVVGVIPCTRNPFEEGVKRLPPDLDIDRVRNLTRTRLQAVRALERAAGGRGANAVVGMRFDQRDVSPAWTDLCAYGTAVVTEPASTGDTCPCRG